MAATSSSLTLVSAPAARADDTQSGAQSGTQSGSWVPGTTIPLANAKSVEASTVSASTLTLTPSTSEQTKIFVLSSGSSDAILVESGGWYGIIDGGEDADLPDGSDPRYPARTGIAVAAASTTDWLLQYLDDQGVNDTNVAFYLGTHAHSDHIANADDIIYKYRPKAILSPEYSDEWITDDNSLWDNQYVYDRLVTAANWAVDSYGATFIQRVDGYNTHIALGGADIQMIPFDADEYYKTRGTTDANLMGWGTKVTANGHTAFLAADLMSTESDWETPNGSRTASPMRSARSTCSRPATTALNPPTPSPSCKNSTPARSSRPACPTTVPTACPSWSSTATPSGSQWATSGTPLKSPR